MSCHQNRWRHSDVLNKIMLVISCPITKTGDVTVMFCPRSGLWYHVLSPKQVTSQWCSVQDQAYDIMSCHQNRWRHSDVLYKIMLVISCPVTKTGDVIVMFNIYGLCSPVFKFIVMSRKSTIFWLASIVILRLFSLKILPKRTTHLYMYTNKATTHQTSSKTSQKASTEDYQAYPPTKK